MQKLKMHSPNLTQENIARIRELFPSCVTEAHDSNGKLTLAVDFDQLRQELSESIVEGPQERYRLDWPGKREAMLAANAPIAKTLRPCREESVEFDSTKNLFIEGDNLDALKLLQETYLGKVKMIYIDPPYNTGNDFIYNDDFAETSEDFLQRSNQKDEAGNRLVANTESNGRFHSDWLTMMYSRLKLARNLLRDDGVIFISIDDGEVGGINGLCCEIFGSGNCVGNIIWQSRTSISNDHKISMNHNHTLVYAKNQQELQFGGDDIDNKEYINPDNDPRGPWKLVPIDANHIGGDTYYPIVNPYTGIEYFPPNGRIWAYNQKTYLKLFDDGRIKFGINDDTSPKRKLFLKERIERGDKKTPSSLLLNAGSTKTGTTELMALFDKHKVFSYPKPVSLIYRLLKYGNVISSDIILDFFSGSATTAHAVMQLNAEDGGNRQFIMVQLPETCDEQSEAYKAGFATIAEIGKERIRRAGKKILEGECHQDWNKDVGFRVLKVDASNMAEVYYAPDATTQAQLSLFTDNIKPDRKPEDLLFQVLLDWGVDITLPIERHTIQGKNVFFVAHNALVACFDSGVNAELVKELAGHTPLRVVFRDSGFVDDATRINVEQIFKQLSPATEVKVL